MNSTKREAFDELVDVCKEALAQPHPTLARIQRSGKTEVLRRQVASKVAAGREVAVVTPDGVVDGREWLASPGPNTVRDEWRREYMGQWKDPELARLASVSERQEELSRQINRAIDEVAHPSVYVSMPDAQKPIGPAPKPLGQVRDVVDGNVLWLHGAHDIKAGDVLAVSYVNTERDGVPVPPLRSGRLHVARVRSDGALVLREDAFSAIPALCKGECGDWLYRADPGDKIARPRDRISMQHTFDAAAHSYAGMRTEATKLLVDAARKIAARVRAEADPKTRLADVEAFIRDANRTMEMVDKHVLMERDLLRERIAREPCGPLYQAKKDEVAAAVAAQQEAGARYLFEQPSAADGCKVCGGTLYYSARQRGDRLCGPVCAVKAQQQAAMEWLQHVAPPPTIETPWVGVDLGSNPPTFVTAPDPLDVKYDGVTLRSLLEVDATARAERTDRPEGRLAMHGRKRWTSAQRGAVSAHWSAQLRAKVEAGKRVDAARATSVVLDCAEEL